MRILVFIPGEGHGLQRFSRMLIRGGRVKDLPAVKYKAIHGKHDLLPLLKRRTKKSKFATKKPKFHVFDYDDRETVYKYNSRKKKYLKANKK